MFRDSIKVFVCQTSFIIGASILTCFTKAFGTSPASFSNSVIDNTITVILSVDDTREPAQSEAYKIQSLIKYE